MKNINYIIIPALFMVAVFLTGCESFWGGAGTGVVGTGAAYEINTKRQMDQIDKDLEEGTITQEEYDIRKDQIRRGSLLY